MIEEKNLKKTFIVATLISTIIGTFTTGINLYDRVGEKRRQKKKDGGQDQKIKELEAKFDEAQKGKEHHAKRADDLKESLDHGGPSIRKEYNQDLARLGPRFAHGDQITQTQLQSQVITLQGTVIGLLEDALYSGRIADVNKLFNASEFAREGSIRALQDQYMRMLQAAPVRRPVGPVRRISSTPTLHPSGPRSIHMRTEKADKAPSVRSRALTEKALDEHEEEDMVAQSKALSIVESRPANGSVKETAALAVLDSTGPLFCRYAMDLQNTSMPLDACYAKGGSQACPLCGTRVPVEAGRAWKIEKEIVHERVSKPKYEEEVIEERTFLLGNRFIIKSHREKAGYACVLCYRHRDRDTICESISGLVKHVWQKHDVSEYESDGDIRELSMKEERISKKY